MHKDNVQGKHQPHSLPPSYPLHYLNHILSYLISSHLVSSRLVSSRLVSSRLVSSHLVSSHLISSRIALSLFSNVLTYIIGDTQQQKSPHWMTLGDDNWSNNHAKTAVMHEVKFQGNCSTPYPLCPCSHFILLSLLHFFLTLPIPPLASHLLLSFSIPSPLILL